MVARQAEREKDRDRDVNKTASSGRGSENSVLVHQGPMQITVHGLQ